MDEKKPLVYHAYVSDSIGAGHARCNLQNASSAGQGHSQVSDKQGKHGYRSLMSEWDPRSFSAYIDAAMRNRGIRNDAELARLSDVRQTQISNWRAGTARPSMRLLRQVAAALDVPAQALYIQAGWIESDGEQTQALVPLPPEITRLIALYESAKTEKVRAYIRQQLDFALQGLKASTPNVEAAPSSKQRRKRAS